MFVVIKIIERCDNPSLATWRSFRNVCIKKMHDICMREEGTKFQLSHIDDVGEGGERGRTCVFTQGIAPTCALYTALR